MPDHDQRPDLDDLIEKFEEDVRQRPTPDELAALERAQQAGTSVRADAPEPVAEPASTPLPVVSPTAPVEPILFPIDIEGWWKSGERVELELGGGRRYSVFARVLGDGPWLTMIHGFPTSSWDWVPMLPQLATRYRVLAFDLLGFGDSDKPAAHDWSTFEQADMVEALWKHYGVRETRVVGHDVGLTVSLELLARQEEGVLDGRISDMVLLNGGVYAGFHRPRPIQVWLQRPVVGALIARMLSEKRFGPALAEIFGPAHQPSATDLHQHWLSVSRRSGAANYHRLIHYIPERRANAPRWEGALEKTSTPIKFVWGMADPVSGAHMARVIRERRPAAEIVELADVGHYPQLEDPTRVAGAVLGT
ncbi:MAG TPA: alpha/beta hydrolase [Candidatus Dormibacteraeota bacterium]|nr:alpha/beta hydrolase [Candidatus Dormibacteraeota bacterium]